MQRSRSCRSARSRREHERVTMSVEIFESERSRLRAVAYRIVGTPDDADDVVQDAWLRFSTADLAAIKNPAAWLTTVTSRLAIDRLRATSARRESYVGPWLSDPIANEPSVMAGPDDAVLLAESLSLGFMAVLERVTPLERAVFILHDVFAYSLDEVADIIERSPAATRQLAKRARDHVQEGRPRFDPDPAKVEQLTQALLGAAIGGEIDTLKSFLADDVFHISDGGPNHRAARAPIVGVERVARFFSNLAKRWEPGMEAHVVQANGQHAIYMTTHGEPYLLMVANWVNGQVTSTHGVRNPEKMAAFHRSWLATQ